MEHPPLDAPNVWVPYRYHPSEAAAIIFLIVFSLTSIFHMWQVVRQRTWYFLPMVIGGVFEIIGYLGRILSASDLWALGPYIMQSLLLLLAPALFAASIYIILGRIILVVDGEQFSPIKRRWLTKLFVAFDVLSFTTQCAGGGIQAAGTLDMLNTGEKVIIVGLFLQLACFSGFIVIACMFHYRFASSKEASATCAPWKRHMYALYAGSALIMVRSIFRVIEYLMGNNGYLLRHEYFLYIFDATLMLIVMVLFNIVHPSGLTRFQELDEAMPLKKTGRRAARSSFSGNTGAPSSV